MQIFTGVVDTTVSRNKEVFWDELGAIKVLLHDSWCIVGDFNKYRFPKRRFSEVIKDLELRDLPPQGKSFHLEQ